MVEFNPEVKMIDFANETRAQFMDVEDALEDRKLFVTNLGHLLSQTRNGIVSAELDDHEIVTVIYDNGYKLQVNVNMDSYSAIIKDVMKNIE